MLGSSIRFHDAKHCMMAGVGTPCCSGLGVHASFSCEPSRQCSSFWMQVPSAYYTFIEKKDCEQTESTHDINQAELYVNRWLIKRIHAGRREPQRDQKARHSDGYDDMSNCLWALTTDSHKSAQSPKSHSLLGPVRGRLPLLIGS